MIKSFKHKGLESFFYTGNKKGIRPDHAARLARILDRLHSASDIKDMNYPGSYCTSSLVIKKGNMRSESRANWRVFFEFVNGDANIVDYDDYH